MVHAVISLFQRRVAVGAAFLAAIALVVLLNHRADRAGDASASPPFHLTNVAADVGIIMTTTSSLKGTAKLEKFEKAGDKK